MDGAKCVICYEKKATKFCGDCKQSSGVCFECYYTLNCNKYGAEGGDYAAPINCVICKKDMDYACFVHAFDMDCDDLQCSLDHLPEEKQDKLVDLVRNNSFNF